MATQTSEPNVTGQSPAVVHVQISSGSVVIDGEHQVHVPEGRTPQATAIGWIIEQRAKPSGQPVTVYAHEAGAVTHFVANPDGTWTDVYQVDPARVPGAPSQQQPEPPTEPVQQSAGQWGTTQPPAPQEAAQQPVRPGRTAPSPAHQATPSHRPAPQQQQPPFPQPTPTSQPSPAGPELPDVTYEAQVYERDYEPDYGEYEPEPQSPGRLNLSELAPRQAPQTQNRWRRLFRMGPSPAELAQQRRLDRLQQPLHGQTFIGASVQIKGGDGKTCSAILTAQAIAENTGHHVVVVSADPANGNLLERLVDFPNEDELMRHPTAIDLYEAEMAARAQGRIGLTDAYEIGRFLALAGRLRGLGGRQIVHDDEDGDSGLTAEQVQVITECLSRVFDVIIFDCGTDLTTAAAKVVLNQAHALVVVANPTWDTLRKGEQSLDSIEYRRPELPGHSTIGLINTEPAGAVPTTFNLGETLNRLSSRVASITEIPYDPWIRGGTAILWDRLQPATRNAAFDLAGHCADVWARLDNKPKARPRRGAMERS